MTKEEIINKEVLLQYEETGSFYTRFIIERAFSLGVGFEKERVKILINNFLNCIPLNNVFIGDFEESLKQLKQYTNE